MAQKIGVQTAKQFSDAHELESENPAETKMDLHNNAVGLNIGSQCPPANCLTSCLKALNDGKLAVLTTTDKLEGEPVSPNAPLLPSNGSTSSAPSTPNVPNPPYGSGASSYYPPPPPNAVPPGL